KAKTITTDSVHHLQTLTINRKSNLEGLACGITTLRIQLSKKAWAKLINFTLKLLYLLVWLPRSITANTSIVLGIKWKKSTPKLTATKLKELPEAQSDLLNKIIKYSNS
ncbi:4705_t:CDS:1, partial [Acaulospora morrowiae]